MQAVVELALEGPLKLRVVEIARVQFELVGVDLQTRVLEADDDLNAVTLLARVKDEQGMFVETELFEDAFQAGVGHRRI